jgi:hypothetical protein
MALMITNPCASYSKPKLNLDVPSYENDCAMKRQAFELTVTFLEANATRGCVQDAR